VSNVLGASGLAGRQLVLGMAPALLGKKQVPPLRSLRIAPVGMTDFVRGS